MNFSQPKFCPYCLPKKRRYHLPLRLEGYFNYLSQPFNTLFWRLFGSFNKSWKGYRVLGFLSELGEKVGLINFESNIPEEKFSNTVLIFLREARERGLRVEGVRFFHHYTNLFRFSFNNRVFYYEEIPFSSGPFHSDIIDNKAKVKKLFQENNLPVAQGQAFFRQSKALRFAQRIGYPLVVKPNNGSLSEHVVCNIKNQQDLKI